MPARLRVGSADHDLTSTIWVVAVTAGDSVEAVRSAVAAAAAAGADVVEVGGRLRGDAAALSALVRAATEAATVPVCAVASDAETAAAAAGAGALWLVEAAVAGSVPPAAGDGVLGVAREAGLAVTLGGPGRLGAAAAAGLPPYRLVVDAGIAPEGAPPSGIAARLSEVPSLCRPGPAVQVSAGQGTPTGRLAAVLAHGIALGARVVRAGDVRAARRVADVVGAVVAAGRLPAQAGTSAGDGRG